MKMMAYLKYVVFEGPLGRYEAPTCGAPIHVAAWLTRYAGRAIVHFWAVLEEEALVRVVVQGVVIATGEGHAEILASLLCVPNTKC